MYMYRQIDFTPNEVLAYLRKSRSDDPTLTVEEVLQKHESILDEWAEKNLGAKVPEENKFREVVSGETLKERPEINIILRMIESPKYKAVAVVEPQRLTRGDLEDIGRLMKLFKHTGTYIITPQRIYDLRDEYDWDAFERELKRGNDYLEYTKKILNRGRLLSVSQGNFIGSVPPYGFDKTWVMDGKRKCPTLKPNKEQADVLYMACELLVKKRMGVTRICNYFDSLGIKPPKGDHWSPSALRGILTNIHNIGKVKWNWRKTVTVVEDSEIIKTRPKAKDGDFLIFEGKQPAIIPEELFNEVLEVLGRNHRAKPSTKLRNPLAGLLYCQCGRAMSLRTYKNKDGSERCSPRLICEDQTHCKTGSCLYDDIIERVCAILETNINDWEFQIKNLEGDTVKLHANLIKTLEKKLKDIEATELSQWEAQASPDPAQRMPSEIFKQLNQKLIKEKEETQQALRTAYESMPDPEIYKEKVARFQLTLDTLQDPDAEAEEKNRLLKTCIDKIEYSRLKPERLKKAVGEKKGTRFKTSGGHWSDTPIELDVKLKV